jgi:hypothetical protein
MTQTTRYAALDAMRKGFDRSHRAGGKIHIACSQCDALVINGIACHETGCSNATHECHGCNEQIPMHSRYCSDCAA